MSSSSRRRSSNSKYEMKFKKKRLYSMERYRSKDDCEDYEQDIERRDSRSQSNSSVNSNQRYNRNENFKYSHHYHHHSQQKQQHRHDYKHSSSSPSKNRSSVEYKRGNSNRHNNNYDERIREREREKDLDRSYSRPPPPPQFSRRYDDDNHQQHRSRHSKLNISSLRSCGTSSHSPTHNRSFYDIPLVPPPPPKITYVSEGDSDDRDNEIIEQKEHKHNQKYYNDKKKESSTSKYRNHYHHERHNDKEHDSRRMHHKNLHSETVSKENSESKSKRNRNSLEKIEKTTEDNSKYYLFDTSEPIDKERIHREIEEKLRIALAKEGKVYPPPKSEASHPVFANDGSFLEIFKRMQEQHQQHQCNATATIGSGVLNNMVDIGGLVNNPVGSGIAGSNSTMPSNVNIPVSSLSQTSMLSLPTAGTTISGSTNTGGFIRGAAAQPVLPVFGRRRGGKILKTGMVAKPKIKNEGLNDPKDFWSLYLAEVNKYKNTACESETGNRPLVK